MDSFIKHLLIWGKGEGKQTLYQVWEYIDEKNGQNSQYPQSCYYLLLFKGFVYFHKSRN